MKNYISINDHKIELTDEQVNQIIAAHNPGTPTIKLADIAAGNTCKIGEHEFTVLEQHGIETSLILKDLYVEKSEFGENNNYDGSYVDERCRDFAQALAGIIGWENIVPHEVDLTSDDGLKDYGAVERRASLITTDMYRKYVDILDTANQKKWWWLATPYSTKRHGNDSWVKCVSPSGFIYSDNFNYGNGVRPFCILKSDIFVSK